MNIKSTLISTVVVLFLVSPIWVSHLVWRFEPKRRLNLLVVDYSVPSDNYWNHKGLFWMLNHYRILPPTGKDIWRIETDYIGFDPTGDGTGTRIADVPLHAYDWIYLADTYGVHVRDRTPSHPEAVVNGFIFGGLSREDAQALEGFAKRGNIVSEFNSLSDPTPKEARQIMSEIMGIEWHSWAGRFVSEFQKVPEQYPWFTALYRLNYGKTPLPIGPGMMLIGKNEELVVLHGAVFERSMPTLALTPLGRDWIKRPVGTPPYYGWFGVVTAMGDTEVLAEIEMPNPEGWEAAYRPKGVPRRFPLLTRRRVGRHQHIYIAANISVVDEVPNHYGLAYLPKLLSVIHRRRDSQDHGPAYWQFFVPVVGKILLDASREIDQEESGGAN
jgi:hypothetical protein